MAETSSASVAALYRHPVKGFTPEPLERAVLTAGRAFPGDRLRAVETGPSGFDPRAPAHISKMRFTVLARLPEIARVRTRWDETTDTLHVSSEGAPDLSVKLGDPGDERRLEAWLTEFLGEEATAPLRLLDGTGHRFMDDPAGSVSVLNLASVRDLSGRLGVRVDPLRFRANVWVEGWPAWAENDWTGRDLTLGEARLTVIKPIVRCVATHVDPETGSRDIDVVSALQELYGHRWCGLYLSVGTGGTLTVGDRAELC
ncbi:MOSC N-terminal beta barrel domain-containing protein [Brevundimonas sp.]|uniref:MOSC domain-containing protein n=1 Tax=Brevundimonas sp. TaxID=1871086 RepID=UPI0026147880|nr:MOSC N-terminal beta barrel domain-containing protein [Brevundimonas sp.]